jgi:hypothetical protein
MSENTSRQITAGTVASPAYRPHALVLAESFLEHHPAGRFVLADLGAIGPDGDEQPLLEVADERIEVVHPEVLAGGREELARLGMAYSIQGLAGAMKPRLLSHLVAEGRAPAMLIDSDICVFGSLDPVADLLPGTGAVVTPHTTKPNIEAEYPTMLAGVFNSGFAAVDEEGRELLDWWVERTRRECVFRPHRGIVWEQSWLGIAPAFFPLEVLRDPGVNAMTPELLDGSDVSWEDERPRIAGRPLLCFHFSGPYDPREPEYLLATAPSGVDVVQRGNSYGAGELYWLSLERRPGALRMSRAYGEKLLAAGFEDSRGAPAPFSALPGSRAVHRAMRDAYRTALIEHEQGRGEEPPNPFSGASTEELVAWLAQPAEEGEAGGLNRFMLGLWSSSSAAIAFPEVPGSDAPAFTAWAVEKLLPAVGSMPAKLDPRTPRARRRPGPLATRIRRDR